MIALGAKSTNVRSIKINADYQIEGSISRGNSQPADRKATCFLSFWSWNERETERGTWIVTAAREGRRGVRSPQQREEKPTRARASTVDR